MFVKFEYRWSCQGEIGDGNIFADDEENAEMKVRIKIANRLGTQPDKVRVAAYLIS